MKRFFLLELVFFWVIPSGFAQLKTYTFEAAEKLSEKNPRPYFIFIHTSWCKYCQMMTQTTFKNQDVIRLLNEHFYFISFDAESKTPVRFMGHSFHFLPTGSHTGYHDLAQQLGTVNGQLSFPVSCILNRNYEIIFQESRFRSASEMKIILNTIPGN